MNEGFSLFPYLEFSVFNFYDARFLNNKKNINTFYFCTKYELDYNFAPIISSLPGYNFNS